MCRACEALKDLGASPESQLRLHLLLKAERDGQLSPIQSIADFNEALDKLPSDYLMKALAEDSDMEDLLEQLTPENYLSRIRWARRPMET